MTTTSLQSGRKRRHLGRYRQIALVFLKYQLNDFINTMGLEQFLPFRWLPNIKFRRKESLTKPERTRMALEELGTSFVKIGQILSTRNDLLPVEYTNELAKLQDSLKPISSEVVKKVVVQELKNPLDKIFSDFDDTPLGVASIGQAHAATLIDGTEVVVKARKPGVVEQVHVDMDILRQIAASSEKRWEQASFYDLRGIANEIAETITDETDYMREGRNADHFAQFFGDDNSVHIPKVFWQYTTSRVITLERIRGIPIKDVQALKEAGFDTKELAIRSVNLWQKMVFENQVFHADPHPGNLFVEKNGRLGLIDFGMMGIMGEETREYLLNAIKGVLERDVDRLVDSLIDLGAAPPGGSRGNLRADLKHLMAHYPSSIPELQMSSNLSEVFNIIRADRVRLPANTFLMLKTMAMTQSLGMSLDPDVDFFKLLTMEGDRVYRERYSPGNIIRRLPASFLEAIALSTGLPERLNRIMRSFERGEMSVRADVSGLEIHLEHLERLVNRLVLGIIVAALIVGITILLLVFRTS